MTESAPDGSITAVKISGFFKVLVRDSTLKVPTDLASRVDEIWHSAIRENSNLFDGKILCALSGSESELYCFGFPFRYIYAQEYDLDLKKSLNLKIVGVSGFLTIAGKVVVGKRSPLLTHSSDLMELVPSGSLPYPESFENQEVEFIPHLISELVEEIGIQPAEVTDIKPFLLLKDDAAGVYDICCKMEANQLSLDEVLQRFKPSEYTRLHAYTFAELSNIVNQEPEQWVPGSTSIIRHMEKMGL